MQEEMARTLRRSAATLVEEGRAEEGRARNFEHGVNMTKINHLEIGFCGMSRQWLVRGEPTRWKSKNWNKIWVRGRTISNIQTDSSKSKGKNRLPREIGHSSGGNIPINFIYQHIYSQDLIPCTDNFFSENLLRNLKIAKIGYNKDLRQISSIQ